MHKGLKIKLPLRIFFLLLLLLLPAQRSWANGSEPSASFPLNLADYQKIEKEKSVQLGRPLTLLETCRSRLETEPLNGMTSLLFLLAICHTFMAGKFARLARQKSENLTPETRPSKRFAIHMLHYLGEVEAIFGLWIIPLAVVISLRYGWSTFAHYVSTISYSEPLFVIVIMAMASTRPILQLAEKVLGAVASLGNHSLSSWWLSILLVAPLLGSFITEPAAITIAALLLAKKFYTYQPSRKLAYATLGLLFVNISVGGTMTHFAAPPILIIARTWNWNILFMLEHFAWKSISGIAFAVLLHWVIFRSEFRRLDQKAGAELRPAIDPSAAIPSWVVCSQILLMAWTVFNLHSPAVFLFTFLFFLAFLQATKAYQSTLQLTGPLLVGFFLAGLITHGQLQQWWIEPVLGSLSQATLFLGSLILSTFNDNASVTYLSSLVPEFLSNQALQYAVVAGAVSGGGLTLIANAPNPAGQSILSKFFGPDGIHPFWLFVGAFLPTVILASCLFIL